MEMSFQPLAEMETPLFPRKNPLHRAQSRNIAVTNYLSRRHMTIILET
jgi:hypothetical protein